MAWGCTLWCWGKLGLRNHFGCFWWRWWILCVPSYFHFGVTYFHGVCELSTCPCSEPKCQTLPRIVSYPMSHQPLPKWPQQFILTGMHTLHSLLVQADEYHLHISRHILSEKWDKLVSRCKFSKKYHSFIENFVRIPTYIPIFSGRSPFRR